MDIFEFSILKATVFGHDSNNHGYVGDFSAQLKHNGAKVECIIVPLHGDPVICHKILNITREYCALLADTKKTVCDFLVNNQQHKIDHLFS